MTTENLFSYGTLQSESVQLATFGRRLYGVRDALTGYVQSLLAIEDASVVATSGETHHPILKYSGVDGDRVEGTVFRISREELEQADRYEVAAYRRVATVLASGTRAWVYINAQYGPPAD